MPVPYSRKAKRQYLLQTNGYGNHKFMNYFPSYSRMLLCWLLLISLFELMFYVSVNNNGHVETLPPFMGQNL